MSDTKRTDAFILGGVIKTDWNWRHHSRQLEREINAAKAENADKLALIKRLHRAITARMSADDPTDEERLELMQAWESAQETIDKAKL